MEHAWKAIEKPDTGEWADVLAGARDTRALDADAMAALPEAVLEAFRAYRTCEFSTFARDGTPVTWPTVAMFQADEGRFVIGTSIGLNRKALQVRREPRVALLFSDPTGSGQEDPPTVLVQGIAECPEELFARGPLVRAYWREIYRHQRTSRVMGLVMRRLDWYHIRLFIFIRPTRISWWQTNDGAATANVVEVSDVA
jgi:hypothetical protein